MGSIVKIANQADMGQDQVCSSLNQMDLKLRNMFTLIMQCSGVVEMELAMLVRDYLLGRRSKSPLYHGKIANYALPLIKLTTIKNTDKIHRITRQIELTRDTSMKIIEKFLAKTKPYKRLAEQLASISCTFHESGEDAERYNKVLTQMSCIEKEIGGSRESLYGAIGNVEELKNQYYEIRNSIVLAYLKLNLGVACRSTTRVEDSFQNGVLGIMHAIDKSRVGKLEDKVFSFANFVKWHIKNAIASTEFNTRTDIIFNIHPQTLKQICTSGEALKKLKGERFIDEMFEDDKIVYIPPYLQEDPERVLNEEERTIIALLNADPSECRFDQYPSEKEVSEEIKKQYILRKRKDTFSKI